MIWCIAYTWSPKDILTMAYKNEVLIFIAGVACGFIAFWLIGILLTPNPSVSDSQSTTDNQPATSVTDIPISSPTTQEEHSIDQSATADLTLQSVPTPTRTELLAYQMALRSGSETESTQRFYEDMLPRVVRVCDDIDGMSDAVDWLVYTHERILDLGLKEPDELLDVSRNFNFVIVALETRQNRQQDVGDTKCELLTRVYVGLRGQGDSERVATNRMLKVIRGY